ncbi:unnamed protein product [Diamesa tonsa]
MKLKNQQYFNQTGETLFAKLYKIIDKDSHDICLVIIDKLFREIGTIYDIENETSIEKVLEMKNDIYKEKILRMLVNYWKVESMNYDHYKTIISKQSSFLNLFIIMKENNKVKFEEIFPRYLNEKNSKHNGNDSQNIIQQDCNCLLAFMLRNNQNDFMDIVILCPQFDVNKLTIESDSSFFDNESITHLMTKLLENGYYVGNDGEHQIPLDWISQQVFEKFLDSKIEEKSRHKVKIDYNFLVDPSIRDVNLKGVNDRNEKLIFSSGIEPIENILNNDRLRSSITHPFDVNKLTIDSEGSSFGNESITHLMTKLLENGYYVGNDGEHQIPLDWISHQVFEKFLDSKIEEKSRRKLKIDYNFLVDPSIRNVNLKGVNDRNEKLFFSSGIEPLENILNNDRLKSLITHPVLSTFINLKTKKYQLIGNTNFYIFLFGFLSPFFQLTISFVFSDFYFSLFKNLPDILKIVFVLNFFFSFIAFLFSIIFLTCRELVQLFWICKSKKMYVMNRNNQFQMMLIALTWFFVFGGSSLDTEKELQEYVKFPASLIIIFGTIELLSLLPYPSMSIYMTMLQQVAKTFVKFFTIFILIILAFTFSFCVAFNTENDLSTEKSHLENLTSLIELDEFSSYNNGSFKELLLGFQKALTSLKSSDNVFQNFDSPVTSFVKTLQMLAGDNLDPFSLKNKSLVVLYLVFILTSFILFNLINGLAISDIQILKQQAEYLNLKKQIRNGAECEGVICQMYNNLRGSNDKIDHQKLGCWGRFVMFMLTYMIKRYPYLHKMDNLCIDLKDKIIECEINEKQEPILKFYSGKSIKYVINDETLDKFNDIIMNRCNEEVDVTQCIQFMIEVESKQMKSELFELNSKLDKQNEELKEMFQKLINK